MRYDMFGDEPEFEVDPRFTPVGRRSRRHVGRGNRTNVRHRAIAESRRYR